MCACPTWLTRATLFLSTDLPKGWEQDVTNDGTIYYIDHNRQLTTFDHPLLGRPPESFRNAPYTSENEP
ncbi:pleckstriny domain-containing family A member 6 isoform X9, partial [Biomphalaria glabrata]